MTMMSYPAIGPCPRSGRSGFRCGSHRGHGGLAMRIAATLCLLMGMAFIPSGVASAAVPGLHVVYGQSAFDSWYAKSARAYCPPGERVLGGGGMTLQTGGASSLG